MPLDARLDVTVDDDATFALTVTNPGPEPVDLELRSGLPVEFTVYEGDTPVWRWTEGKLGIQALGSETIPPDDAVTYAGTWDDPEPGAFTVEAALRATNASIERSREFVVDR